MIGGFGRDMVSMLAGKRSPGHLSDALVHVNRALDEMSGVGTPVEVARLLFDGLNKVQTEWLLDHPDLRDREVKAFQSMVSNQIQSEARSFILQSQELESFVRLGPLIMNHRTLQNHSYRPDEDIEPALAKVASEEHRRLNTAYDELVSTSQANSEVEERVMKRAAELLYIVRSNLAHGEKTPYGPDLKKRQRDEAVCAAVVPVQLTLLDLLLDRPSRKLVVYGTLAPGQSNHGILGALSGRWENCTMLGFLVTTNCLRAFTWSPSGTEVPAHLFTSSQLPDSWKRIDEFEGESYARRLIPVSTETGITISNVYLASRNPWAS
jgi:gamma-glutamylcyclotransferase (GGCT)/AIG2-like uncharacterized protein YtfP